MHASVLLFKKRFWLLCKANEHAVIPWWYYCNAGRIWYVPRFIRWNAWMYKKPKFWLYWCVLGERVLYYDTDSVIFSHLPECKVRGLYFKYSGKGGRLVILFPWRLFLFVCAIHSLILYLDDLSFSIHFIWTQYILFYGFRPSCCKLNPGLPVF